VAGTCTAALCQPKPWTCGAARWNREWVYVVTVPLLGGDPCSPAEASRIADLLRAVAVPRDGLEHVYVQATRGGAGVVLFLLAASGRGAEAAARSLYDRARAGGLAGYRLGRCRVDPLPPMSGSVFPHEV
jgi:hypothetical protein